MAPPNPSGDPSAPDARPPMNAQRSPGDVGDDDTGEDGARGEDAGTDGAHGDDVKNDGASGDDVSGDDASGDGVPDFRAARRHVLIELVRLASVLRADGVQVSPNATLSAARALSVVGLSERDPVAAALRASLLSEADDGDAFEEAFPSFWHRLRSGLSAIATDHDGPEARGDEADDGESGEGPDAVPDREEADPGTLEDAEPPEFEGDDVGGDADVRISTGRRHATGERGVDSGESDRRRASGIDGGETVDVDPLPSTAAERSAVARFVDALATLPGRRRRPSSAGPQVDARRALRNSLATGGAPMELPSTAATESELRCCLLVDVSGSVLDTIDRGVLLSVAAALSEAAREARVFLFDTDLADVTEAFDHADGDPAAALRAAAVEWGGGTEIGGALATLRREHPHAIDRRTVVVVVSDGLDVGDPDLLERGITWLSDRASAVVWLNPLAVSPSFEPRSRGMGACDPYVDALFGFAGPGDLAVAARQLERRGLSGAVGYQYDPRRVADADGDGSSETGDQASGEADRPGRDSATGGGPS